MFVSYFYNFALSYINKDDAQFFEIILEENEESFYFTLWNEKISLLFKNYLGLSSIKYIYKSNRISIKLMKNIYKKNSKELAKENHKREKNLINSVSEKNVKKFIPAYTFISDEDLSELIQLSEDLQDIAYQINKTGMHENQFITLRSIFSLFCFTLNYYNEVQEISLTANKLLNLMNTNKEKFIALSKIEFSLLNGFISNVDKWVNTLFINGGADLHFMDNSMKSDYETILQVITPVVANNDFDLDDIFDF